MLRVFWSFILFGGLLLLGHFAFVRASTDERVDIAKPQEFGTNQQAIVWLIEDTFEGDYYKQGPSVSTSQGTARIVINKLRERGFNIEFIKASGSRIAQLLKTHNNACIDNRLKIRSREKYSYYSLPQDIYLGLELYRLAGSSPLPIAVVDKDREVINLPELFDLYPGSVLGIADGISYGVDIDRQLSTLDQTNIYRRAGSLRLKGLLNMLLKERIDYAIFYPSELSRLVSPHIALESYSLAGAPDYMVGHFTCSKTTAGKDIISEIDEILTEAYQSEAFYQAHSKWNPAVDLPRLNQYYLEVFNTSPAKFTQQTE